MRCLKRGHTAIPRQIWISPIRQQEFFSLAEMQDYYEDRSESWQESERGEEHQEKSAATEAVVDALSDLLA